MGLPCSPWLSFQSGFALKSKDIFLVSLNLEGGTLEICIEAVTRQRSHRQTPARSQGRGGEQMPRAVLTQAPRIAGPGYADCALGGRLTPALQQNHQKTFQK